MLDVHPPHYPTHTWKDFFIHIATIVVGLLIAIGLEQIVEHIHQHYELRELRESLDRELEANRRDIQQDVRDWRWEMAELQNDLMVLHFIRQHPGVAQADLPGDLLFLPSPKLIEAGVWDSAQQKGILTLMPVEETNRHAIMYAFLKEMARQGGEAYAAFNDAGRFDVDDGNPTHLSPAELDQVIQLVQVALQKQITEGYTLALLHSAFPDLGSTLTYDEVNLAHHYPFRESPEEVARAHRLTVDRLAAAGLSQRTIQGFLTAPAKR
jgi:hypothetical protein